MAVDFTTDIGKVRALTGDTDDTNYKLSDEEIDCIIGLEDSILLAAAQAAEAMAMKVSMELGAIKTLDFQTNARAVAQTFMERAKVLREQHANSGMSASEELEFVEIGGYPFEVLEF